MKIQLANNEKFEVGRGSQEFSIDDNMTEIHYGDLVTLRDNAQLIPGRYYRITDYETIGDEVTDVTYGVNSHPFDVIVRADTTNTLNENAYACRSARVDLNADGEDYWGTTNFSAWRLKYCLDNDKNRFEWAASVGGFGVIYYMKDEFNNEASYDFKNISFYIGESRSNSGIMKDYIYYTFCRIESRDKFYDASLSGNVRNNKIGGFYDSEGRLSLRWNIFCVSNNSQVILSNTLGVNCAENGFSYNCCYNDLGDWSEFNDFGSNCEFNKLSDHNNNIQLADHSSYNTFGNGCTYNTIETNCSSNEFGVACSHITFDKEYTCGVTVEANCQYITLTSSSTTSASSRLKGVKISLVTNSKSQPKTISHDTVNDTHQTIYRAVGSQTVEV